MGENIPVNNGRYGPVQAAVMYFDIKDEVISELKTLALNDKKKWAEFTSACLSKDGAESLFANDDEMRVSRNCSGTKQ